MCAGTIPPLKGYGFTPHECNELLCRRPRIGVPGHRLYKYSTMAVFSWTGTSLQITLTSACWWVQVLFMTVCFAYSASVGADAMAEAQPPAANGSIHSLCSFLLVFFVGQSFSRWNARFENVCRTNGNVTRMSALAAGSYPKATARTLLRYTNAIMHVYYMLLPGPMDDGKWCALVERGLLTAEEVVKLNAQGSPGVVLYAWAMRIVETHPCAGRQDALARAAEDCLSGTRGLAAKQIAYARMQVPFLYFHSVALAINVFLACETVGAAAGFGDAVAGGLGRAAVMAVVAQLILITLFLVIYNVALMMSDFSGDQSHHYDFGADLDGLWAESQNALASMDMGLPKDVLGSQPRIEAPLAA